MPIMSSRKDQAATAVPHNRMNNAIQVSYLRADVRDARIMKVRTQWGRTITPAAKNLVVSIAPQCVRS